MKLTILGSGSLIPVPNRGNPGYLLDIGDETVILDGGSGTVRQITRAGRSIWEVHRIFYSHFHIDHTADLIPLLFAYKYSKQEYVKPSEIVIHAHPDFLHYFKIVTNLYYDWISNPKHPYKFEEISPGLKDFGSYKVTSYYAKHTPQSLIFRFEDRQGKTFVYTGDTDYCEGLIEASMDADCILIECSFPDSLDVEGHMTPKKVSKLINDANLKRVIVTHIYPENDDGTLVGRISAPSDVEVEVAEDLQILII